jgi:phosphate transport system protein
MQQPTEGHTVVRYDGELNSLHMLMLEMGSLVLDQVRSALKALKGEDLAIARQVLIREHRVDELEIKADDEIVSVIARRGPVARDLRIIMAFSKTITDLERVGDEAARIASIIEEMYETDRSHPSGQLMRDVHVMGALVTNMLDKALGIIDGLNAEDAEIMAKGHQELDAEFRSSLRRLTTFVLEDARNVGHAIYITLIIKALERIGDHSRNLAEYVVYLTSGEDIRHQLRKLQPEASINNNNVSDD